MTQLDAALRHFEATEANLRKLEALWERIRAMLPGGPAFGAPDGYDEACFAFRSILPHCPAIDGVRITDALHEYDALGQWHLDAMEVGELEAQLAVQRAEEEQGLILRTYRLRFQQKRRKLVRGRLQQLINDTDGLMRTLQEALEPPASSDGFPSAVREALSQIAAEFDALFGADAKPPRWSDFKRHLSFGALQDATDILGADWPTIRKHLLGSMYGEYDAIPVPVDDLATIVAARPTGPVTHKLLWDRLSPEDFERLLYLLVADTPGYDNPGWLQHTHAPDKGRDLSVVHTTADALSGVRRRRTIIQCKHWLSRSVAVADVGVARDQMPLWQPPRVDQLIIATSGRFTADAVQLIEQHNQSDRALEIAMWPESHLERVLASRPHLIAQFRLRG